MRHSVRDSYKFPERRIRLPGKTGSRLLSSVDAGRRQALPLLFAFLKPFGGMRRIGAAEHLVTPGQIIFAVKIGFAPCDRAHQPHRGLLAERRSCVISRLMLEIAKDAVRNHQLTRKILPGRLRSDQINQDVSGCERMRKSSRYPIGPAERLRNLPFPNPEPPAFIDRVRLCLQEFVRNRQRS